MQKIVRNTEKHSQGVCLSRVLQPYVVWIFVALLGFASVVYVPFVALFSVPYSKALIFGILLVAVLGYGGLKLWNGKTSIRVPRVYIPATLLVTSMCITGYVQHSGVSGFAPPALDINSIAGMIGVLLLFLGFGFMRMCRSHISYFILFLLGSTVLLAVFETLIYIGLPVSTYATLPSSAAVFALASGIMGVTLLGSMRHKLLEVLITIVVSGSVWLLLMYGGAPTWMWLIVFIVSLYVLVQQCLICFQKRTRPQIAATLLVKEETHVVVPLVFLIVLFASITMLLFPQRFAHFVLPPAVESVQLTYADMHTLMRTAHEISPVFGLGPNALEETWHQVRPITTPEDELSTPVVSASFIGLQFMQYGYIGGVLWLALAVWFVFMGLRIRFAPEYYDQTWYWYARALFAGGIVLWAWLFVGRGDMTLLVTLFAVIGMLTVCYQKLCPSRVREYALKNMHTYVRMFCAIALWVCALALLYAGTRHAVSVGYYSAAVHASGIEARQLLLERAIAYMPQVEYKSMQAELRVAALEKRVLSLDEMDDAAAELRKDIEETATLVRQLEEQYPNNTRIVQTAARLYAMLGALGVDGALEEERVLRERLTLQDPASDRRFIAYLDVLLELTDAQALEEVLTQGQVPIVDTVRDRYLAETYMLLGKEEEAFERYAVLVSEYPQDIAYRRMYILLAVQVSGPRSALPIIDEAQNAIPTEAEWSIYKALAYTALNEHAQARAALEQGLRLAEDTETLRVLLDEHERNGMITSMSFVGYELSESESTAAPADLMAE